MEIIINKRIIKPDKMQIETTFVNVKNNGELHRTKNIKKHQRKSHYDNENKTRNKRRLNIQTNKQTNKQTRV